MVAKKPHKYHLTCKHEHTKQIEMCQDCGDIITAPMNQIILVQECFSGDPYYWIHQNVDNNTSARDKVNIDSTQFDV